MKSLATVLLAVVAICVLVLPQTTFGVGPAQAGRTLERVVFPSEPMQLTALNYDGSSAQSQTSVVTGPSGVQTATTSLAADNDWLGRLSFSFKNRSGKRIVSTGGSLLIMDASLPKPLLVSMTSAATLAPGEETTLSVFDSSLQFVERQFSSSSITHGPLKVQFVLGPVVFADDTSWDNGSSFTRDPADQRGWIRRETAQKKSRMKSMFAKYSPDQMEPGMKFISVSYKPATPKAPMMLDTCIVVGGYQ